MDGLVACVVMNATLFRLAGICYTRKLVDLSSPSPEIGVFVDVLLVAFEMCIVHHVKSVESRKQAQVCHGDLIGTAQVSLSAQQFFQCIQTLK